MHAHAMDAVLVQRDRAERWAVATWLVTVAGAVGIGAMITLDVATPNGVVTDLVTPLLTVVAYGVGGAVLIDRRPDLPFGWLLGFTAMTQVFVVVGAVVARDAALGGDIDGWARAAAALTSFGFLPVAIQGLVNVRFPTGRPATRRGRVLERMIIAGTLGGVVGGICLAVGDPTQLLADPGDTAPSSGGWLVDLGSALQILVPVVVLLGLVAGIGVVVRYRRAEGIERQQLKWRAVAVVVAFALFPFAVTEVTDWIDPVDSVLFVVTLAVPVLRHRLWSIDTILRRSAVYTVVAIILGAAYLALASAGAWLVSERFGSAVAAVVVALGFGPMRSWTQRTLARVAYGNRDDPERTIRALDRRLAAVADAGRVLPVITETVASSLRLPYVAIETVDGTVLAATGTSLPRSERWSIGYEGLVEGMLVASPRRGEDVFDERDRKLLAEVAAHAGAAVRAEVTGAALLTSRHRLVSAREEERRRLRRDLHDGLGPLLTGVGLSLDAARSLLESNPTDAARYLGDARDGTSQAIGDIRRLVYGLRPPSLDHLGLAGAIEQHVAQLTAVGLHVDLDVGPVGRIPAAVEVAVYRITVEALANAINHGEARGCGVVIERAADDVRVEIVDDGHSDGAWTPGVGLLSMREQVDELGGTVWAGPSGGGGRVEARIPLAGVDA